MPQGTICSHPGCQCSVPADRAAKGEKYCSPYCASHMGDPSHKPHDCACGHSNCATHR